jgi:hypothetical protein
MEREIMLLERRSGEAQDWVKMTSSRDEEK